MKLKLLLLAATASFAATGAAFTEDLPACDNCADSMTVVSADEPPQAPRKATAIRDPIKRGKCGEIPSKGRENLIRRHLLR